MLGARDGRREQVDQEQDGGAEEEPDGPPGPLEPLLGRAEALFPDAGVGRPRLEPDLAFRGFVDQRALLLDGEAHAP
jgi:hypothetical protein